MCKKIIYLCVPLDYDRNKIQQAKDFLVGQGYNVYSTNDIFASDYTGQAKIRRMVVELCDIVYILNDNYLTNGLVKSEILYAKTLGKKVKFHSRQWKHRQIKF